VGGAYFGDSFPCGGEFNIVGHGCGFDGVGAYVCVCCFRICCSSAFASSGSCCGV
jgi:hypothetical protein